MPAKANATRIWAAAPALLEALEALMPLGDMHTKDDWAVDFDKAEAAITKAKKGAA